MKFYTSKCSYLLLFKSIQDATRCNHTWATTLEEIENQIYFYNYHKNVDGKTTFISPDELIFTVKEIDSPNQSWQYFFVIAGEKTGWVPVWKKRSVLTEVKSAG